MDPARIGAGIGIFVITLLLGLCTYIAIRSNRRGGW